MLAALVRPNDTVQGAHACDLSSDIDMIKWKLHSMIKSHLAQLHSGLLLQISSAAPTVRESWKLPISVDTLEALHVNSPITGRSKKLNDLTFGRATYEL